MSAAHTPGPLTVRVGANGDVGIIAPAQKVIAPDDIGGALIAECYCEIRRAGEGAFAEALANATLFAASHDMLEALKTTAGNIRSLGPAGAIPESYKVWLDVVETAIAQARGATQ